MWLHLGWCRCILVCCISSRLHLCFFGLWHTTDFEFKFYCYSSSGMRYSMKCEVMRWGPGAWNMGCRVEEKCDVFLSFRGDPFQWSKFCLVIYLLPHKATLFLTLGWVLFVETFFFFCWLCFRAEENRVGLRAKLLSWVGSWCGSRFEVSARRRLMPAFFWHLGQGQVACSLSILLLLPCPMSLFPFHHHFLHRFTPFIFPFTFSFAFKFN